MSEIVTDDPIMSADTGLAPIHTLGYDILWTIFWTNANIHWTRPPMNIKEMKLFDGPRALDVLRYSSQVCRQWREIILGSPSLWGMAIELDLLIDGEGEYWVNEVMRRAAQSTLYISGWFDGIQHGPRTFFASLLNENWERIRRLDVGILRAQYLNSGTWNGLFRPSAELEIIRIQVEQAEEWYPRLRPDDEDHPPVFADTAPSLYEFSVHEVPAKWFSLQAPWLSQLHSLVLSTPFGFNATDVLIALARIPALEHLVLKNALPPIKEQLKSVSLPNLRSLNISKDFTTSLFLLKWITPGVGSTLILNTYDYAYILDQDMHTFCKEIGRYIDNFFGCAPFARSLFFEPGGRLFNIKGCRSNDGIESSPVHEDFSVSIVGGKRDRTKLPVLGPQKLTASLSACRFTHITTFEFQPTEPLGFIAVQPSFIPFFSCLQSVNHLIASPYGLGVLLDLQETTYETLFPYLTKLQFRTEGWLDPSTSTRTDSVSRFLKSRLVAGKPITVFDVSESIYDERHLDWTYLDAIEGLKVILRDDRGGDLEEYICGTGEPERLNLRKW